MRVRFFLATAVLGLVSSPAVGEGEPACPADEQPAEAAELEMPLPTSTGEMHNPQEADVVVEFVVDSAGLVSTAKVIRSETWAVRARGPTMPHYFDQVALKQVTSRKYRPRSHACRGEATFRFRFKK